MRIPKKYLGNRPSDFGSAKDDSGQKAEQSNNSIQNFHDGILLQVSHVKTIEPSGGWQKIGLPPDDDTNNDTEEGSMTAALAEQRLSCK